MLSGSGSSPFTPLAGEQTLYQSPPRIGLSISTPSHYPAKQQQPFSQSHPVGRLYLTNRRIIYLPDKPSDKIQSFAAPLLNLHDSHVTAPFFGPNVWIALLQPVQGGGIPIPSGGVVELKLTFKDGGAFDFHTNYERVRERLQQAVVSSGGNEPSGGNAEATLDNANLESVNLEDLPAYREQSDGPLLAPIVPVIQPASPVQGNSRSVGSAQNQSGVTTSSFQPPAEPPPAYEDTI